MLLKGEQRSGRFLNPNSEDFYENFICKSPYVAGDSGEKFNLRNVEWVKPDLIRKGQEFIKRYLWAEVTVMISSLLLGVSFKGVTTVLLRTDGYSTVETARRRRVETAIHVRNWLTNSNLLESGDKGFDDLQKVRKQHMVALQICENTPFKIDEGVIENKKQKLAIISALQKDLAFLDTSFFPPEALTYTPTVLFSQFDMAMVLFGLYAPIFLYPEKLGLSDINGMKGYMHFWAVIGKCLGIKDEFNVALHADRDIQIKLFQNVILPSIKNMDLTMLALGDLHLESISNVPSLKMFSSYESILYTSLKQMPLIQRQFRGENLFALLSWKEVAMSKVVVIMSHILYYVPCLGQLLNWLIEREHKYFLKEYGFDNKIK